MKLLIVGGVAGGASAAARTRRLDETAEIIVFERGPEPSFANCGLPYYIGGTIEDRGKLLIAPRPLLENRYRLDVRVRSEVVAIDRERKTVHVRDLETAREYDETYDQLILAPGAAPLRPPIAGIDHPKVYTLRNLEDTDRIAAACKNARRALVVGAGFIGLELAENLVHRGLVTTVVEMAKQVLPPWDAEMVAPIADHLRERGVTLHLGDSADAFEAEGSGVRVRLKSGAELSADVVMLCAGVRPENELARAAGLAIGQRGGIVVDAHQQTSDPDIYAAGDAVETHHATSGERTQVPLAGPANRQGRLAANVIFGRESRYRGTQGTAVVGVFGMTAAMTGHSERTLTAAGADYQKIYIHPASHAGYYPGAEPMTLKLLFEPGSGSILGAQAVGGEGVARRIDVLSVAIQGGMSVFDLEECELCYAPQYGSAKDPINMAGFVAAGVLRGEHPICHANQVVGGQAVSSGAFLLDVRTPAEFERGTIPGAVNIPIDELRSRLGEIPANRPIVVFCQVGMRGYLATRVLLQNGYDAANLSGGYKTYQQVVAAGEG